MVRSSVQVSRPPLQDLRIEVRRKIFGVSLEAPHCEQILACLRAHGLAEFGSPVIESFSDLCLQIGNLLLRVVERFYGIGSASGTSLYSVEVSTPPMP